MAFDNATRGRLQRFVTDARALLTSEFANQFQQDYGLDPESGAVAALSSLAHLDDQRLEIARILREILDHYLATEMGEESEARKAVLGRMVREQAFTTLNRLAALRMMEARGLVMECVGKGYQSKAFQLYQRVAGTGLGETGDAYRVFLLSFCDLYSEELPLLFDRRYPNGKLFPREPALLPLLELINAAEIEPLWAEDETIGWIYQYFNGKEERKAMRDASLAPRNGRELAVRNQFFTPRYVVEFLVDNTLGRLWFNWTGGQTALRDRCQYLMMDLTEAPEPARRLRDPRTIKLLDPACGSMHFGLYAFDLLLEIYSEAWEWEQSHGVGCLDTEPGGGPALKPLCQTYAEHDAFVRDVPRLIIEHNIYGVDIDPRATQIASLALWLRAQRALHESGVKAQHRPAISRGHVVAAVAPPAEVELRKRIMEALDPRDGALFEKTLFLLKGLPELGVLLQIEKDLPALIRKVFGIHGGLFSIEDLAQWQNAEIRLRDTLSEFVGTVRSTYQGQLFAHDALEGLRLIETTTTKFDIIVMNPPFGALSRSSKDYISEKYPTSSSDLLAVFVERSIDLLNANGRIGCITSRTAMFLSSFDEWRGQILRSRIQPVLFADLGQGVLDAAMVETAAYCLAKNDAHHCTFVRVIGAPDKASHLQQAMEIHNKNEKSKDVYKIPIYEFDKIPGSPFSYWVPTEIRDIFPSNPGFESADTHLRVTNPTADEFRYLRNFWECKSDRIGREIGWAPYAKGGSSQRYYYDVNLVVRWDDASSTYLGYQGTIHRPDIRPASLEFFFRPGVMWPLRAHRMSAQAFPAGTIFSARSQCLFAPIDDLPFLLGLMNSYIFDYLFKAALGRNSFPEFIVGVLRKLPKPSPPTELKAAIGAAALAAARCVQRLAATDEIDHRFLYPRYLMGEARRSYIEIEAELDQHQQNLDDLGYQAYGLSREIVERAIRNSPADLVNESEEDREPEFEADEHKEADNDEDTLRSWCVGVAFGRFDWRLATGERAAPSEPDPFKPLPARSPGMLPDDAEPFHRHSGILVDEPGHIHDLPNLMEEVLTRVRAPVALDIRRWLQRDFFLYHLQRYSKSRRKAPIYWPLATTSGSYTLWIYYPNMTSQTLYTAINDFLEPKIEQLSKQSAALRSKGNARSRDEDRSLEVLQTLEAEVAELRDTLLRIASTYRPNHDDGVPITAAPLWPLFRHKPWQKLLKETWGKLESGDYDWSHLAMAYWPERVREKCKTDKSLAIAHGLENFYVPPEPKSTKTRGRRKVSES